MECPDCRTENLPESAYCANCGVPLPAPQVHGAIYREPGHAEGNLAPRELGDLIGETLRVYRGSFWPLFAIALLAQAPLLISALIPGLALTIILSVVGILMYIMAEGAIIFAVAQQYLGREVQVSECYGRAIGRFWTLLVGLIVFFLALVGSALLVIILIGIPLFFYLLVSRYFFPQAIILEDKGSLKALGRSRDLVRGSWWQVFGIGIVFVVMLLIVNMVATIPGFIADNVSSVFGALLFIIAQALIMPIGHIGVNLDLRVRKEGYTLDQMASEIGA